MFLIALQGQVTLHTEGVGRESRNKINLSTRVEYRQTEGRDNILCEERKVKQATERGRRTETDTYALLSLPFSCTGWSNGYTESSAVAAESLQ